MCDLACTARSEPHAKSPCRPLLPSARTGRIALVLSCRHLSKETRVRVDAYRKAGAEARAARMATRRGVISGDDGSTATVRDDGTSTPEPRRPTAAAGRGESEAGSPSSPAQLSGASASASPMDSHSPNAMDSSPGGASTASRDSVKDVLLRGRTRGATAARAAGSQYGLRRRTSQSATSLQPLPAQPGASDDEWRVIEQPTTAGNAATSDGAARVDNDDAGLSPNASPSKGATSAASGPSGTTPKTDESPRVQPPRARTDPLVKRVLNAEPEAIAAKVAPFGGFCWWCLQNCDGDDPHDPDTCTIAYDELDMSDWRKAKPTQ